MDTVPGECQDTVAVREEADRMAGERVLLGELLFWTSIRQYLVLKNIILTRWVSTTLIFCYKVFFLESIILLSRQK